VIEVQGLAKRFGSVQAVSDVSFCARDGSITGLLGPNGAGKTTTLRMIYTILTPERGTACVDGHDSVREDQAVRSRIGVLPDARGLYPRLTAREHIWYFGRLQGLPRATLATRIDELLELLEMHSIADRKAEGFSAGERLKVALARGLVHGPRNLLLDEPTTGLDVMSTRSLRRLVLRLRDEGNCILLSTHVMQEVAALCDQIVVMAHGRVAATGTPAALIERMGKPSLEEAFVAAIGTDEGLLA
jgi:sodium transport system ATP-binding protein